MVLFLFEYGNYSILGIASHHLSSSMEAVGEVVSLYVNLICEVTVRIQRCSIYHFLAISYLLYLRSLNPRCATI